MTNDEAYQRLMDKGCSRDGALRFLAYAYQAQYVGSWASLLVTDFGASKYESSEGAKYLAMDVFRDAGIDPMTISFPENVSREQDNRAG